MTLGHSVQFLTLLSGKRSCVFAMQNHRRSFILNSVIKLEAIEGAFQNRQPGYFFILVIDCSVDTKVFKCIIIEIGYM